MIIDKIGHLQNGLYYLGLLECPIFLLDGPKPVIFDAGMTCAGKLYVDSIRAVLGERQPAMLCLSHVHWDHCGAAAYLQKAFPEMKIAATSTGAKILQRPNALDLITRLNSWTLESISTMPKLDHSLLNTEPFTPFKIDIELQNNQIVDIGNGNIIQVLATPGHTQDHLSYYLPRQKILIAGEAAGVFYSPEVISPEFAADYDAYLASLKRLAALSVKLFIQGHYYVLAGEEEIKNFFKKSIHETIDFKTRVLELLDEENGDQEKVLPRIKAERYDAFPDLKQPEMTYMINLTAKVAYLARKRQQQTG